MFRNSLLNPSLMLALCALPFSNLPSPVASHVPKMGNSLSGAPQGCVSGNNHTFSFQ